MASLARSSLRRRHPTANSTASLTAVLLGAALAAAALTLHAQAPTYTTGTVLSFGGSLPGTCNVGELYAKNTATIGLYYCSASNTWSAVGGATPGGTDTQVQYNDSSAFGGDSGLLFNETSNALTIGGATVTVSTPTLNLAQTWNAGAAVFNGVDLNITNTASDAASLLVNYRVGGTTVAGIGVGGFGFFGTGYQAGAEIAAKATSGDTDLLLIHGGDSSQIYLTNTGNADLTVYDGSQFITALDGTNLRLSQSMVFGLANNADAAAGSVDIGFGRNATGVGEINNGSACSTVANCRDLKLRHLLGSGTAPTVSNTSANSCGTTAATIDGRDTAFRITVGATSGTSCTVTFGVAFATAPSCQVTNETTANLLRATSTTTTTVVAGTMVGGDLLTGTCIGW